MIDPLSTFDAPASGAAAADPLSTFDSGEPAAKAPAAPSPSLGERLTGWLNKPRERFEQLPPERQARAREAGARSASSAADMALMGLPQLALGMLSNVAARNVAAAKGATRDEANAFGKEFASTMTDHPILAPFTTLTNFVAGQPENLNSVDKVMKKVDELIGKGGKAVEEYTKGAVRKEDFELATQALMLYIGESAKTKIFSKAEPKRTTTTSPQDPVKTFEDISKKYGAEEKPGERPSEYTPVSKVDENLWTVSEGEGVTNLSPKDLQMNAKEIAYRMMREGASKAKVESFINRNKTLGPLVAKEMEAIRARRGDVQTSRLGIVIQGEVLDALRESPKTLPKEPGEVVGEAREVPVEQKLLPGPKEEPIPVGEATEVPFDEEMFARERVAENASGESAASLEAQSRLAQEKAEGKLRYTVDTRTGEVRPLTGVDAVDAKPGKGELIVQAGVGKSPWTVLAKGEDVGRSTEVAALARAQSKLDAALKGGPNGSQRGSVDPKLLAKVALTTGGALLAMHMVDQDKLEAAIAGGTAGLITSLLPGYVKFAARDVAEAVKGADGLRDAVRAVQQSRSAQNLLGAGIVAGVAAGVSGNDPVAIALASGLYVGLKSLPKAVKAKIGDLSIDDMINLAQGEIAARERETGNLVQALRTAVPDQARRAAISQAIDKGDFRGLSETEAAAARAVRDYYKSWGEAAKDAGVIQDLIENYVTHLVEKRGGSPTFLQGVMASLQRGEGGGGGTFTPHSLARKYSDFSALQKALADTGLQVKTLDIADIVESYGRSMGRAIENKRLFTALEAAKEPAEAGGHPLIMDSKNAPASYVRVESPQLRGKLVHPNMADALKFYTDAGVSNQAVKALLAASLAQKRLAVGGSLFHASNLAAAHIGASGRGAFDLIREVASPLTGKARPIRAALDVFKSGGAGDAIDTLLKSGLRLEGLTDVDTAAMAKFGAVIDGGVERMLGVKTRGAETALGALEKIQRETFDKITWDYMHTGMKALTAMRLLEEQMAKHPELSKAEVAKQVSSFVNDTYGGLNWQRVMTESQTQLGKWLSQNMLSRPGRTAMQILMFAPDWTLSTFRAAYKALPGATDMPITRGLHQAYVVRSALMYFGLMNAFNIAMSGHPLWENKDPLMLETSDGRKVQVFKHAMEGAEWVAAPTKTLAGKLGGVPKEIAAQISGREYLGRNAPPMEGSRLSHAAKAFVPFAGKGLVDPSKDTGDALAEGALGALGVQIYGRSDEQKAGDKARRKAKKEKSE